MRILVVENSSRAPAGLVGRAIRLAGGELDVVTPRAASDLPADLSGHGGMVVLGGPQSANDDGASPWLPHLMTLIRSCRDEERPMLGICLGAQVAARSLGGRVYVQAAPEIGFRPVELTADGRRDPLFAGLGPVAHVMQWHFDAVVPPPGAVVLATGVECPVQAFRCGRSVYGVQFHPEVTAGIVGDWIEHFTGDETEPFAHLVSSASAQFGRYGAGAEELATAIGRRWYGLCEGAGRADAV